MMTLPESSFLVRTFFFYFRAVHEDTPALAERYRREGTNLCFLIRIVFFWLPAWALFCATMIATVIGVAIAATLSLFFGDLGWPLGALVSACGGILVALLYLGRGLWGHVRSLPPAEASPTTVAVRAWIRARKERLCPLVTFSARPR